MPIFYLSNLGSIGVAKDPPAHALPPAAWSDALNVVFIEGQAQHALGYRNRAELDAYFDSFYWAVNSISGETAWWTVVGTLNGTEVVGSIQAPGGGYSDRTPLSGLSISDGIQFSGGQFDGTPIIASGRSNKVFYVPNMNSGGICTELSYSSGVALSTKLKFDVVRPMWQQLIGLGVEVVDTEVDGISQGYYPRLLWTSDSADPGSVPGSWDADDAATLARSFPDPFQGFQGGLVDILPLGQDAIVYQIGACHFARFTGAAPNFIQFQPAFSYIGAFSPNCVSIVNQQHVVLTDSDVVIHNGVDARSVLDGKLRRWLMSSIDPTYYKNCFVVSNHQQKEVWICFPEANEVYPNKAVIWNYEYNTTTIRELTNNTTYGTNGRLTPGIGGTPAQHALVLLAKDAQPQTHNTGVYFGDNGPSGLLEKTDIPIEGDSTLRKLVTRIWPEMEASSTVQFYVGDHDRPHDPPTWQGPFAFDAGVDHSIPVRSNGRLHAIKITWDNCPTVKINRIGLEYEPAGRF